MEIELLIARAAGLVVRHLDFDVPLRREAALFREAEVTFFVVAQQSHPITYSTLLCHSLFTVRS